MLTTLFVYGTLMPGHLRWGLIAPFAVSNRAAEVDGQLFDTGRGWPAARFTRPLGVAPIDGRGPAAGSAIASTTIPGWLVELAPASVVTLLAQLDEVEGATVAEAEPSVVAGAGSRVPPGDYRRVRVQARNGVEAWAYEALVVEPAWVEVASWDGVDEN